MREERIIRMQSKPSSDQPPSQVKGEETSKTFRWENQLQGQIFFHRDLVGFWCTQPSNSVGGNEGGA